MKAMQRDVESSGSVQPDLDVEPRFYTLDQTARYLNVSRPQVYSLVRSGELPAIKVGGRGVWRVDRHQLDAYIERLLEETREWALAHPLSQERRDDSEEGLQQRPEGDKA
jgi:excisionase family DNA binding protein